MKIGKKKIGNTNRVYIVAEAGINHNGDISIAKKMIKTASRCGTDAIKFQTIIPEELFSKKLNPDLYKLSKKWVFNIEQHKQLKKFADKNNIEFFSTPMGKKSLQILEKINVNVIKIASGDLDNIELITAASKTGIPLMISTGMSNLSEITNIVKQLKKLKSKFLLLHCISSYPTNTTDANLSTITFLKDKFHVPVGYSDHTLGIETCLAATALGACVLEKHFTLDKKMTGPDQKLSADPDELAELVSKVRIIEKSLGIPRIKVTKPEQKFRKAMRKSIGAARDLKKGTKLKKSDLTLFRPGTGIPPIKMKNLIGKRILKNVRQGELLSKTMF